MADDKPNQSNKPINGKVPKHIDEAINKRSRFADYDALHENDDYRKLVDKIHAKENSLSKDPNNTDLIENIEFLNSDLRGVDKTYHDKLNSNLANTIATYTKDRKINQRTTSLSNRGRFFRQAKDSADLYMPTESIEGRIQTNLAQVNQLGMETAGEVRALGHDDFPDKLKQKMARTTSLEESIAFDKRLLKVQNKAGLSTEKLFNRTDEVLGKSQSYFGGLSLSEKVASGNVGSLEKEETSLAFRQAEAMGAQKKYDDALSGGAKEGSEELKNFVKSLVDATEALDDQQKVVGEMRKQGYTGGMGGTDWLGVGKAMTLGGAAVAHVARSANVITVDHQAEQAGHRARFAATGNRLYNRSEEAIMGGNMDAMMEMVGGSVEFAKKEADNAKQLSNFFEGGAKAGDLIASGGRIITTAKEAGPALGTAAGIAQTAVEGANTAVSASDYFTGNFQSRKQLNTFGNNLGLAKEVRQMDAKMFQAVYDQGTGAYNSVAGLGGASGMAGQLMNIDTINDLAGVGISGTQANQLAGMSRAAGSASAQDRIAMIKSAGEAKQKGQLGREEYTGLASQLMGAGGSGSDLSDMIAAGFDNSKLAGEMVANTMQMSAGLTAMGVSSTSATGDMLSKIAQDMQTNGMSKNLSTIAAANTTGNLNKDMSNLDFNLGNIVEFSQIKNKFGGNQKQVENIQALDTNHLSVLMAGAEAPLGKEGDKARNEAALLMDRAGITKQLGLGKNGQARPEDIRQLGGWEVSKQVYTHGGLGIGGITPEGMREAAETGIFSQEQKALAWRAGTSTEAYSALAQGKFTPQKDQTVNNTTIPGSEIENTQAKMMAKLLADAMGDDKKDISELFKGITETLKTLQEKVSAKETKDLATTAAKDMSVAGSLFKSGATTFDKTIIKLITHLTSKGILDAGEDGRGIDPALQSAKGKANTQDNINAAKIKGQYGKF